MYFYGNWRGRHNGREITNKSYGIKNDDHSKRYINDGKISIHLDLKTGQLSFSVDDIHQGIAFYVEKYEGIKYRLMVSMSHQNGSVEVVQFHIK